MTGNGLAGRCALVTGAVAGLGNTIAERLAAEGASVVLNGLCEPDAGAEAAARLREAYSVNASFDPADLRSLDQIEAMFKMAEERHGGVDVLVNNAVVRNFAAIEDMQPAQWDESIAVNLTAAFHCIRLALPGMKARRWGRIVNMSSAYGQRGAEGRTDYVVTKTALIGLTRAVALEAAPHDITCNALSPGTTPTPAILGKLAAMAAERGVALEAVEAEYLAERHPTGRFVSMENVAAMAAFLCSPAAVDVTGAVLPMDGGWTAS